MNKKINLSNIPLIPLFSILMVLFVMVTVVVMELTEDSDVAEPTENITEAVEATEETMEPILVGGDVMDLGFDLKLHSFDTYAGIFMEDGSDEIVTNVARVLLTNQSQEDLQYAQITVTYADEVCNYTVTNLPAGASVVLLEQARKPLPEGEPVAVTVDNVAFFQAPMNPHKDVIEISGVSGIMNVKNVSDTDITGDIYVYYKYTAANLYYGGITFRVRVQGGLGAGQIHQGVTTHFDPDRCTIVDVAILEP